MRWLIHQGATICKDTFNCACESGNLVMMGYVREYHRLHEGDCPFSDEACVAAARHGHLEALKWLRSEGCPWGESPFDVCSNAVLGNHLHVLKWALENGCALSSFAWAMAESSREEVKEWLRANKCPVRIRKLRL